MQPIPYQRIGKCCKYMVKAALRLLS
jgi:hypothetical protein